MAVLGRPERVVDRRTTGRPSDGEADVARAAAAFLRALAGQLRPLMRHVGIKIRRERQETEAGKVREELLGLGLVLIDEFSEEPDHPESDVHDTGSYGGWRLVMLRDGTLFEQGRHGRWNADGSGWWKSNVLREVAPEQAAIEWDVDPVEVLQKVEEAIRQGADKHASTLRLLEGRRQAVVEALGSAEGQNGRSALLGAAEALERPAEAGEQEED